MLWRKQIELALEIGHQQVRTGLIDHVRVEGLRADLVRHASKSSYARVGASCESTCCSFRTASRLFCQTRSNCNARPSSNT